MIFLQKLSSNKLYFINLGAYDSNKFEELHESKFMVGMEKNIIKNRAKKSLLVGMHQVHNPHSILYI